MATSQPLGYLVQHVVTALAALGVAFYNSWKLTLVTLATFPIAAFVLSFTSSKMQPAIHGQERNLAKASKCASNAIAFIETVKCFNGLEFEAKQYAAVIKQAAEYYSLQAHANAFQIGFVRLVTLGMFVQGFWYGSSLVGPGKLTSGQVLTTFWAALMATQAIEQILPQMIVLEKGRAAGASLHAVRMRIQHGRRLVEMVGKHAPAQCAGDIDVRGLSFAYPARGDHLALDDVSLFFPAGETTFVVGGSGSGKSTIGNLLLRFYPNWGGSITLDGNAIQTLDLAWLRRNVTLVQQQSVLFNETLFRNIAFGRADHERVMRSEVKGACQVALLQHTINDLPDGLDTMVSTGGLSMSGGQRQRVAIARARLRDSPVLILDESTSALDYISRSLVMDAIREWRQTKTTIIITHDVSQIYEDDYVYVLDNGRVVQRGYKAALEKDPTGLFYSFLPDRKGSASSKGGATESHVVQPKPAGNVFSNRADFRASKDSLDIQFPQSVQYVPTVFGGSAIDLRHRRPSQNQALPLAPLVSPPPPRFKATQGIELVEFSGQVSRDRRLNSPRTPRTPRTPWATNMHPPMLGSGGRLVRRNTYAGRARRNSRNKALRDDVRPATLRRILTTVWPNLRTASRVCLVLGFLAAFVHAAATPVFSFLFAKLLATFFMSADRKREALRWSLSVLGVAVGDAGASYAMHYLLEMCGQAWVDRLRTEALRRVLSQPRAWFDDNAAATSTAPGTESNSVARLAECLDRNAEEMRNLVGRFAGFAFVAAAMMGIALVWSVAVCWKLTLVGLAAAPIMYAVTTGFEAVSGRWEGLCNSAAEAAGVILAETFTNIKVVRALTLEKYFRAKYARVTRRALRTGLKRSVYSGLFYGLSDSVILFITGMNAFSDEQNEDFGEKPTLTATLRSSHILLRRRPRLKQRVFRNGYSDRLHYTNIQHRQRQCTYCVQ
jgi:ATP-binding cassette subfamily B (MDR/TAP) protein 1